VSNPLPTLQFSRHFNPFANPCQGLLDNQLTAFFVAIVTTQCSALLPFFPAIVKTLCSTFILTILSTTAKNMHRKPFAGSYFIYSTLSEVSILHLYNNIIDLTN